MNNHLALQALSFGFKDGGVGSVTNFPGFNSHILFTMLGGETMSLNERLALELAYGASIAGKRSVCIMKSVGLNVASDVFFHVILNGVNAGMVLVVMDDMEGSSSPERQDSRPFRDLYGGLWLEPTSLKQAYEFAKKAFEWSEELDIPVVIRITNNFFKLNDSFKRHKMKRKSFAIDNNRSKYIGHWLFRENRRRKKIKKIDSFVEKLYLPIKFKNKKLGEIIFGNALNSHHVQKKKDNDVLSLYTYPIPTNIIRRFLRNKAKVKIYEEGGKYGWQQVLPHLHTKTNIDVNSGRLIDNASKWTVWSDLINLFEGLRLANPDYVMGDEGTFTDENTKTISNCLCMGASVGVAGGMSMAGVNYPFCVVGDVSFQFGGKQALDELRSRDLRVGIIVIDNGGARSTGGQIRTGDIYDVGNVPFEVVDYKQMDAERFYKLFKNLQTNRQLSVTFVKV